DRGLGVCVRDELRVGRGRLQSRAVAEIPKPVAAERTVVQRNLQAIDFDGEIGERLGWLDDPIHDRRDVHENGAGNDAGHRAEHRFDPTARLGFLGHGSAPPRSIDGGATIASRGRHASSTANFPSRVQFALVSNLSQTPLTPKPGRQYSGGSLAAEPAAKSGMDSHAVLFARVSRFFRGDLRTALAVALAARPRLALTWSELLLLRLLESLAGVPDRRDVRHGLRRGARP